MPSSYSIGDHYEAFAKDLVASGRYASVSEVLRDGLRLMEEREALRAWKLAELKKGDPGRAGQRACRALERRGRSSAKVADACKSEQVTMPLEIERDRGRQSRSVDIWLYICRDSIARSRSSGSTRHFPCSPTS